MNQTGEVKARIDGRGDGWANEHRDREKLGPTFNMNDLDGVVGMVGFAANTSDRLFMEYVPDNYKNKGKAIRQFATVALFDRKSSLEYAMSESNSVSLAWYLDLCRRLGKTQSRPPKFFFVIGRDEPPWRMVELDINTAQPIAEYLLNSMNWKELWEQMGLKELRNALRAWIDH